MKVTIDREDLRWALERVGVALLWDYNRPEGEISIHPYFRYSDNNIPSQFIVGTGEAGRRR